MMTLMILMQAQKGGGMQMFIMLGLIFLIMWFFMFRPQQKKQKEIQKFRNSIAVGTPVVTAGGIYGVVKQIVDEDNTLILEIAHDVKIKIDRNSVYASVPNNDAK